MSRWLNTPLSHRKRTFFLICHLEQLCLLGLVANPWLIFLAEQQHFPVAHFIGGGGGIWGLSPFLWIFCFSTAPGTAVDVGQSMMVMLGIQQMIVQLLERKSFVIWFLAPPIPHTYRNPNTGDYYRMVILHYHRFIITTSIIHYKTYFFQTLTMPKSCSSALSTSCPRCSKQTTKAGTIFIPVLQMSKQSQTSELTCQVTWQLGGRVGTGVPAGPFHCYSGLFCACSSEFRCKFHPQIQLAWNENSFSSGKQPPLVEKLTVCQLTYIIANSHDNSEISFHFAEKLTNPIKVT